MMSFFQQFYSDPKPWLNLFEEMQKARSELPISDFRPTIIRGENESFEQSVSSSLRAVFKPISQEILAALGDRFEDGQWPSNMRPEMIYFLRVILAQAMLQIGAIAPTSERPLTPTIIPFPKAPVAMVALWFCSEWWQEKGGALFERQFQPNKPE